MKKLMILGGSRYVIPIIEAAHSLGVYVITCDYLPGNEGHKYSDEYHNVSIIDRDAVLKLAIELKIDGITSFATDPGVVVAAYVAEKLNLPTYPYEAALILQNKDRFRKFLEENGFNVPKSCGYSTKEDAKKGLMEFELPVIVKPVDSAGSKGVNKIEKLDDIDNVLEQAFKKSFSGRIIIEEFIEQDGFASDSDCFSIDNELVFASFDCQRFDKSAANEYIPAAYSWPSTMANYKQEELRKEIQRLIKLLNLGTNVYNVESRVGKDGKAYIMECSPRGGGNRLSEMLKYASNQDIILNHVKAVLGFDIKKMTNPKYDGVWAEYIIHSNKAGILNEIIIDEEVEKKYVVEKDFWYKPGDKVPDFRDASDSMGTIVLHFENQEQANYYLDDTDKWIKIIVDIL